MKKKKILGAMLISMSLLAACSSSNEDTLVNTSVGSVTQSDLTSYLQELYGTDAIAQVTLNMVLENKYSVSEEQIDKALTQMKAELGEGYQEALEGQSVTEETLRRNIKYQLLVQQAVADYLNVSDEDLEEYHAQWQPAITVQHILVDTEEKANEVVEKLGAGAPFEDLVLEYSLDETTVNSNGLLAGITSGTMEKEFEKVAFSLSEEGEISEPVKTIFGWHIIKLVTPAEKSDFETNKEAVKAAYIEAKMTNEVIKSALGALLEEVNLDIKDSTLESAFNQYLNSEEN